MRVLLIGKFPPVQGGISSKTYWLYRSLSRRCYAFDVVTLVPELYACTDQAELPSTLRVRSVRCKAEIPWFIPGGGLETERLISAALELAASAKPDVVECNYLAPYATAAWLVSRSLGVPLIVRHAGSDLAKLLAWNQTRSSLELVIASADLVVSNSDAIDKLRSLTGRILVLPRYSPDPDYFNGSSIPQEPLILYAGKLNYYWRLKALDALLSALHVRPDWNLLGIAGGKGKQAFEKAVKDEGVEDRVRLVEFLPPHRMPEMIRAAGIVWAVERPNEIPEFSNIIWEALACGRACLVANKTLEHSDSAMLSRSPLLVGVDPDDVDSITSSLDRLKQPVSWESLDFYAGHREYVDRNASMYQSVCRQ